ncbi:MAG: putative tricarboxylic transport membrane protein [Gammaproteobacteria bacterium]|jgi:putative tricarboxylic transport membrane protein
MRIVNFFRHSDRIFAVIVITISAILYLLIGGMDEAYSPGAMAASSYPRLILVCTILVSGLLILRPAPTVEEKKSTSNQGFYTIVLMVIYIALLEKIGFFILTPLFLFVLPYMVGFRRYRLIFLSVIVVTAALYGVFVEVLNIPLPQGLLGD